MNHPNAAHHQPSEQVSAPPFWRSRYVIGLLVPGSIAAYFLLSEHRAHFIGALPYLLLQACPLMHIFMHGGHGSGHGNGARQAARIGWTSAAMQAASTVR